VHNLSETDLLDYLMTSEFDEGLSPEEMKFLLIKFRNFYRIVSCSVELSRERAKQAMIEKDEILSFSNLKVEEANNQKSELINKLNRILNKKLSWKERFLGKIIESDENK